MGPKYFKCEGCDNLKPIKEREIHKVVVPYYQQETCISGFTITDLQLCKSCRNRADGNEEIPKEVEKGIDQLIKNIRNGSNADVAQ